jgi:hypothetical protein
MLVPVTVTMPAMGPIGKGPAFLFTNDGDGMSLAARLAGFVAIYSADGLRDEHLNARLGEALKAGPFPPVKRLRRDQHERTTGCWAHGEGVCYSQ